MAFAFGNASVGNNASGSGDGQSRADADLDDIQTEQLGFQTLSGDDKLRLLPQPWPNEQPPSASASLLSVASRKGLVAAAGPDRLVLASTKALRETFVQAQANDKVKNFEPQGTISIPRINQLCFTSDESCLIIAAEQGGGLAVYDTSALANPSAEPAFQLSTQGVTVRQLVPNPNPANDLSRYLAVVLHSGHLLLADLKERKLVQNAQGNPIFLENVICACWSPRGKQMVAGRQDGTAIQIDPHGIIKAEIPKPPQLSGLADNKSLANPLAAIYWLENAEFLFVHTPENPPRPPSPDPSYDANGGMDMPEDPPSDSSQFHLVRRDKPNNQYVFQTVIDPTPAFIQRGRVPARHFIERLKDWPPNLDDTIVVLSTISSDVGLLTKSKTPLNPEQPVINIFTTTMPTDVRRAGMPLSIADGITDTSAIGMALDLSATESVPRPIPNDESLEKSPVPLPALYVLNNEGMLSAWWMIYNDSIRQKVAFPDLIAAGGPRLPDSKAAASAPVPSVSQITGSNFASPMHNAFGSPSTPQSPQPTFGSTSTFGGTSALGQKTSLWGSPSDSTVGPSVSASKPIFGSSTAFGSASPFGQSGQKTQTSTSVTDKPTFGSSTVIGGSGGFGQIGGLGVNRPSPWGSSQATQSNVSTSGTPSNLFGGNTSAQSPFATAGKKESNQKASPFSAFSTSNNKPAVSPFAAIPLKENSNPWQSFETNKTPSLSAQPSGSTISFASGSSGGTAGVFGVRSQNSEGSFSFGKPSQLSREETMDDGGDDNATSSTQLGEEKEQKGGLFGLGAGGFKLGSGFKGDGSAKDDLPKPENPGGSLFGSGFGSMLDATQKKSDLTTPVKTEPESDEGPQLKDIPAFVSKQDNNPSAPDPLNYKAKRFAGDVPPSDVPVISSATADPLQYKPKRFAGDVPPSAIPGDVPTPPGPKTVGKEDEKQTKHHSTLAGSPPIDLGSKQFSDAAVSADELPAGPEDDDEEDWDEEEDEEEDEGEEHDGEDDDEDEDEDDDDDDDEEEDEDEDDDQQPTVTDPAALAAFQSRISPPSPKRAGASRDSVTPLTEKRDKKVSFTPAGFPMAPVIFSPPGRTQESPRSPSPQRSVTAPLFSKSQPLKPLAGPPRRIAVPPSKPVEQPKRKTGRLEQEAGDLEDEEDARVKAILNSKPDPTKELPPFLAHQDYVGQTERHGIGGQIEKVYRDINSMIDTLGLNARSLQAFVDGHTTLKEPGARELTDLEDERKWALDEVDDLVAVQHAIEESLENGKLEGVGEKLENCHQNEKEIARLRMKTSSVRQLVKARTDPEQAAAKYLAPLPAEVRVQQVEIREMVKKVQRQLNQLEEAEITLRADLASTAASSDSSNRPANVPTFEAVMNTIARMTATIEKKSGDIDVLESQIKRLPNGIASLELNADYEDDLVSAMRGSRLPTGSSPRTVTPSRRQRTAFNGDPLGMSGMFGVSSNSSNRFRTPPARRSVMFSPETSMLGWSTSSLNGSARKKLDDITDEEVSVYNARMSSRARVLEALRLGVEKKGVRVVRMEEN